MTNRLIISIKTTTFYVQNDVITEKLTRIREKDKGALSVYQTQSKQNLIFAGIFTILVNIFQHTCPTGDS